MNAAERLWRGLARRDWEAARAQFHPSAIVERAGTVNTGDVASDKTAAADAWI